MRAPAPSGNATPGRAASRARHRAILDAALDCFGTLGYARTTLEDIRARSGASTGSVYHHFASKEDLANALYLDALAEYQRSLLRSLPARAGAKEGIRGIVGDYLRWVARHPGRARYLLHMRQSELLPATRAEIDAMNRDLVRAVRAWMQPHVRRGELRNLGDDVYVALLVGPCHEIARQWLAGRASSPPATAAGALGEAVWRAVSARPAAKERTR